MKTWIDYIIYAVVMFMCLLFYNLCFAKLNNNKLKIDFKKIIIMIITVLLIMLNLIFNKVIIKIIINFVIFTIELKLIFKDKWKNVITNYIFIYLFLQLIEIVMTNVLLYFEILTNNSSANALSFITMILTITISLIEYLLISLPHIKELFQKLINFFLENKTIYNVVYLIFVSIVIISIININNFANSHSIILMFILCFIFIILFISNIHLKYHSERLTDSNKKLIDYNDNYGKFLDEYKIYKHNINHKLAAIKSFGNKKVNSLIDELLNEENAFSIRNNGIYNVPNGIKGLVAQKLYNKNYDVLLNNKIKGDPFSKLDPKAFNSVSEALGIALDNAVEASEKMEHPIILMDLYEDDKNLYIKIGNNFKNNIDADDIGNINYSTKNRGSGFGLFSIRKNKLINEKINIINEFYYIELQIKKAC